jgi:mannose-6-phosphate isomerase-like protein (cupin superfamily)
MKFTVKEFLEQLPLPPTAKWTDGVWDTEVLRNAKSSLILFAPKAQDFQTFHNADEYYFIVRGTGELLIGDERFTFESGDAFFVPAKVIHRFENFSEDFATWAVFV